MNILLSIEGAGELLRGVRLTGSEGLSELFRFEINVVRSFPLQGIVGGLLDKLGVGSLPINPVAIAQTVHAAMADHAGRTATLTFDTGESTRTVRGMIAEFVQLDDGKTGTAYRAVLVPEVTRLLHRRDNRIFQERSAPEIVAAVLESAGVRRGSFRFALGKDRMRRDYCVQYRETDWAFVSRLLEEEGIHYFFDDDSVLVMADGPTAHAPISGGTLAFRAPLGAMAHGEHVSRFAWAERVRSGKVTLRDYEFRKPALSLETAKKADEEAELEVYEYPGRYETPERGAELAAMQLEELRTRARSGAGESDSCRVVPGKTLLLMDHPDDRMNGAYLVMRVEHQGTAPIPDAILADGVSSYENRFEVVGADVRVRPTRTTPRPVISGPQTAVVVGPGKEELHTDAYGRVKVQFHWDRQGKNDERSSCWLRVMQASAGAGWGAQFLPRVGHEVVVAFLEGDPDRPFVIGSLYHAANVPPYALPQQKTRSGIRTKSFGGDGHNEIRFDDATGAEELYLHAQRDYNEVVEHDRSAVVHGKRMQTVDGDDAEHVRGNQGLTVDGSRHVHVRGNQRVIIDGDEPKPGAVRGGAVTVRGKYELDASDTVRVQAPNAIKLECGGSSITVEPGKITITAGGGATIVLDPNALVQSAAGSRVLLDANAHAKATGGAEVLLDGNAFVKSAAGSELLLDGNARVTSTGGSELLLDGNALVSSPGEATLAAPAATVAGEALASLAGPGGAVKADGGGVSASGGKVNIGGGAVNVAGSVVALN
ncbi:type VI secretion system Vgr family protein [Polyangium sorediatum]|uniref:Type VI secretion system tip protein TssI/VgrG n=1 Tax=Polyangium sorediatum TaxID=889274 RepID=A0ABT6P2U0_9BACT|nr:type VI secretion system tip protein TssI/VgrG [Polyangium sorediatum]MDI1434914.1 type VI secretion system tip protein TssI/VgrG [Polyangium sorediatum]